jgi:hypothetical protein
MTGSEVVGRLVELSRLHADGILDDEEFARSKRSVLATSGPPSLVTSPQSAPDSEHALEERMRACPYCSTPMGRARLAQCPSCGWQQGWVPVSEVRAADGSSMTQFAAEQPIRGGRMGLVVFTVGAFAFFLAGMGAHLLLGLAGLATLALAIYACSVTRFGTYRYGLAPGPKIVATAVITIGRVLVWCSVVGIVFSVLFQPRFPGE